MRLQIGCVNHDGFRVCALDGKTFHHPAKHAHNTPTLPTIIERLVRPVLPGCIPPPQAIAIDKNDPAQNTAVINPTLAVALGKIRRKPRHMLICQPIKVAHDQSPCGA